MRGRSAYRPAGGHEPRTISPRDRASSTPTRRSTASSCSCRSPTTSTASNITGLVDVGKDVDGLTAVSAGLLALGRPGLRPCTPSGVMRSSRASAPQLEGAEAVVDRALEPVRQADGAAAARRERDGHVCHSRTRELARGVRARRRPDRRVGRPQMVKGDWVKAGAIVIDVGVNRLEDGLVGDVDFEAARAAGRARSRRCPAASAR